MYRNVQLLRYVKVARTEQQQFILGGVLRSRCFVDNHKPLEDVVDRKPETLTKRSRVRDYQREVHTERSSSGLTFVTVFIDSLTSVRGTSRSNLCSLVFHTRHNFSSAAPTTK